MNLNALWSGNDYAYFSMKGRGESYRSNAQRVRLIRCFKKKHYGNERESGYALVFYCDDEGNIIRDQQEFEVRARDIAMRWEEYADERDHRAANRARIEADAEAARTAETAKKEHLLNALEAKGIPRAWVNSITDYDIRLNRYEVQRGLEVNGQT